MKRKTLGLIAFCVLLPNSNADILRVGGPNGVYTEISHAIAAAQDGDTILFESGYYLGFTVDGKSLTIAAASDNVVMAAGAVSILNVDASQSLTLGFTPGIMTRIDSLHVSNCAGPVRVEGGLFPDLDGMDNVITNCPNVVLEGSTFWGHSWGLRVIDSEVAIYRGVIQGFGGTSHHSGGTSGVTGLYRTGIGQVFLSSSTVSGGGGGDGGWGLSGGPGGCGAHGVTSPGVTNVRALGCTVTGGSNGTPNVWCSSAVPMSVGINMPGIARLVTATPIVFDNAQIELIFQGEVGEQVSYAVSDYTQYVIGPEIGPLLVQNPQWTVAGTIPVSGFLHVTHDVADIPALDRTTLFVQGLMTGGANDYLTNASRVQVLDRGLDDCTIPNTPLGVDHCSPNTPNSTGQSGRLSASGSHCVSNNQVNLVASLLPLNEFGYVLNSTGLGMVVNPGGSLGTLCLGGGHPIGRHNSAADIRFSGTGGGFALVVDMTSIPGPNGSVTAVAGQGWAFQVWHRDGNQSHFTNAVAISFH